MSSGPGGRAVRRLFADGERFRVPSLFGAEVLSTIRRLVLAGVIDRRSAEVAVRRLSSLPTRQHPFEPFLRRAWELRDNVSVYDAWYVALAESLDTTLVTADRRLLGAPGPRCPVLQPADFVADRDRRGSAQ